MSEGFFPDLYAQRENGQTYGEALDTGAFLDAISAELRGSPVYAADARTDAMRAAADELRQMLAERGLDPDALTDAEMRRAIEQMSEEADGFGYEQAGYAASRNSLDVAERRIAKYAKAMGWKLLGTGSSRISMSTYQTWEHPAYIIIESNIAFGRAADITVQRNVGDRRSAGGKPTLSRSDVPPTFRQKKCGGL